MKVIGHEKNVVHGLRHRLGLNAVQIAPVYRPGDGENVLLSVPPSLPIQSLSELPEQEGKILLVLGPVDHAGGPAGDGILPIQVHAVQIVCQEQVHTGPGKELPAFRGSCRVGKSSGVVPAAQREHELQVWIPSPQGYQLLEVLSIPRRVPKSRPTALNFGEGVVNLGELLRRELVRRIALGSGPGGVIPHCLPRALRSGGGAPMRPRHGQQQDQQQGQWIKTT